MMLAALLATGSTLLYAQGTDPTPTYDPGIMIGGNVYGGGSEGAVGSGGSETKVRILGGTIEGSVFGGGEKADVNGGTHVQLDGAYATDDIIIGNVYGGNDIAGVVSGAAHVESTYGADHTIKVTNLFGGGNGDYDYTSNKNEAGDETNPNAGLSSPDIDETQIDLKAGIFGQVFGGGNKATVTESTTITLNNQTTTLLSADDAVGLFKACNEYQFGRVFGGNNKTAMAIRPTWALTKGSIDNLYSGGNAGDMTSSNGILLAVKSADMTINNMFGGCRMADVNPGGNKSAIVAETLEGISFPEGHSARVLVTAGKINNVYGGNDVSGNVYGGSALEIRSSIIGDIYGGGNGSYNYTDKQSWVENHPEDADYLYAVPTGMTSAQALYAHRPNAEAVDIHISGTSEANPTYVGGSLFCGGNSATLAKDGGEAVANLKIGSYVIAKNVFLGSNGANMVTEATLQKYANTDFSGLQLTNSTNFEEYMRGCEVSIKPFVSFESTELGDANNYVPYSTKFESLFCGGNVGSMSAEGYFNLDFLQSLVIYQKLVGGCNNANVAASTYNAAHQGGLITHNDTKVQLNIAGVIFEPRVLTYNSTDNTFSKPESLENGLLKGGNIYGGCYQSGYINGGVEINITEDAISPAVRTGHSAENLALHRDDVFNTALSAFGGGYGEATEIWGDTRINISGDGDILKVFGGGEMGVVGQVTVDEDNKPTDTKIFNTTINQTGGNVGIIYGGGFEGLVTGNTTVKLDGGEVFDAFGGACNADIHGYAELLIGSVGTPVVGDELFGGNDFGGQILGTGIHDAYDTDKVKSNTYVLYHNGTVAGGIYGGSYGSYDYTTDPYLAKAKKSGFSFPSFTAEVTGTEGEATIYANSFVDIQTSSQTAVAGGNIYGGGYGYLNIKGTSEIGTAEAQLPIVDMKNTYVLLRSANTNSNVATDILGGGYYSVVENTRVDVRSGLANNIYGGTYGATAATSVTPHMDPAVNYRSTNTVVNVYDTENAPNMNVFGGGANAGSVATTVNLLGGTLNEVYGGSNMEGVVVTANVNVPANSTSVTKAIFGGGFGNHINLPCDVFTANVNWSSATAYVSDGVIYGGNNSKRATKFTNVVINTPVKKSASGDFASIVGGGNGENTVAGYTSVTLNEGAQVKNIYGGGRDGKVFGYYDDKVGATAYYNEADYERNVYAHWAYTPAVTDAIWGTKNADGVAPNTNIIIKEGSTAQNVYGAGYGEKATVSGNTYVKLNGGTVTEDIFGGGYSGNLYAQVKGDLGTASTPSNMTGNLYTFVDINGGTVRNVYGGGFNGNVGNVTAECDTRVKMGDAAGTKFLAGVPAIQRSLYGGGYKGAVIGTAKTRLFNGYVGYNYVNEKYVENLNYADDTNNLLKENGNAFGGGFGEGATVDHTDITIYGGTIRNSLYGGGEIAAIGRGTVNSDKISATITHGGSTLVNMYGGLVTNDVFGGGRGYAIDAYGNTTTGEVGYSDGYTFGTTEVYIHRGIIGTENSVAAGHGNVFGGGNIGYVYTASGTKSTADGYYYNNGKLTEDCKVVISPSCLVTADGGITIGENSYAKGAYVPVEELDKLSGDATQWGNMDDDGIIIGNAVFAGGNVSSGSDKVYANAKTVFGNATASVIDVFNKDFITIGDDGIGGLYGDGNLTFVDGYRELNITNYGTDYYNLNNELEYGDYLKLTDRERSYFELQYVAKEAVTYTYYRSKSQHNVGDTTYKLNQKITKAQYDALDDTEKVNWEQGSVNYPKDAKISELDWSLLPTEWQGNWARYGFCTLYAGRMLNTIQRADFCGVFGSRICLRGAEDRVTDVADYTLYTINRVKEVSLNQEKSPVTPSDAALTHGNYFGIYNVVNYLGALTSDVDFWSGVRETDNSSYKGDGYGTDTWAKWKDDNLKNRSRNNGNSPNQVALASGVWLEILDESTETNTKDENGNRIKVYGPITGVIELALLSVATGEGGGYVYAKNVHGERGSSGKQQVTLTEANNGAVSQKQYVYAQATADDEMQSSGNFIHSTKQIVDDCFPMNGAYYGSDAAPAHYWYIRGEFYVYDQYISAYTGSAQAYAKTVNIPLSITAQAQGKLQLESVDDNYYAYWSGTPADKYISRTTENAIMVGGKTYVKNDPISYWDYSHLTAEEQAFFTKMTYVCSEDISYSSTSYKAGDVILPDAYNVLPTTTYICTEEFVTGQGVKYTKGQSIDEDTYEHLGGFAGNFKAVKDFFHITNAVSHDNGFLLTFDWDNPDVWNDYYHKESGTEKKRESELTSTEGYIISPTFRTEESGVYGQQMYEVGDLVEEAVFAAQSKVLSDLKANNITDPRASDSQASFSQAYIAKEDCEFKIGDTNYNYVKGAPISYEVWNTLGDYKTKFETGYICTDTYQMSESEMIVCGDLLTQTEYDDLATKYPTMYEKIRAQLSPAYICYRGGLWGGNVFVKDHNYEAVKFGNLSASERAKFYYNYDALDLLSENFAADGVTALKYQGAYGNNANKKDADKKGIAVDNPIPYAQQQSIDYTATYVGASALTVQEAVTVIGGSGTTNEINPNDVLTNTEYEKLTNEQACYSPIVVRADDPDDKVYHVANQPFQVGDVYYSVGKTISDDVYNNLADKNKVINIAKSSLPDLPTGDGSKSYYFCAKQYNAITAVTDLVGSKTPYAVGSTVPVGTIISGGDNGAYKTLKNEQKDFAIDGKVPTETSTLYVSRETSSEDLSQDKIVTVVYWYEYVESDETGSNYETIRERHIVNVHIHFESGVPSIGELLPPSTVLPGTKVGLNQPSVSKGAYEILGGGWEMYRNLDDAQGHKNALPYVNNNTKMYWYQDGYYVAYYAKSYLGKTYSNPVQFSVANYHRMDEVVNSKHNGDNGSEVNDYMYVDEAVKVGKRDPKIYIKSDDELKGFAQFFTTTTTESSLSHVKDAENLNFFLQADINHEGDWTPIGTVGTTTTDEHCFKGTFNGDGHTISGLSNSLFGDLCGDVYNLGATGSFTGGGVADTGTGYVENGWVATTGTPATNTMAVFGKPSRSPSNKPLQIVNCYYPETNDGYLSPEEPSEDNDGTYHGKATMMPVKSFINGEVAFNLNNFYLTKRYHDIKTTGGDYDYNYWIMNGDRSDKNPEVKTGYYTQDVARYDYKGDHLGYVENYYGDGDFRYSNGIIPFGQNIRESNTGQFFPIYPDDYIFFGQNLSFDADQDIHPSTIVKEVAETENDADNRLIDLENTGNRVYRAPAYYGSKEMSVAHFNNNATFAGQYELPACLYNNTAKTYDLYKRMTAIDFSGYNDNTDALGFNDGIYCKKVTDFNGLTGFKTSGITQNLLAYLSSAEPYSTKTNGILTAYFNEPKFNMINTGYRNVEKVSDGDVSAVKGHIVEKVSGNYVANSNHFIVDKQNFNAPIAYSFADDKHAWYQRTPNYETKGGKYANGSAGWETICLPFEADLVTTPDKGEITHFYGSAGNGYGHEYWLRELTEIANDEESADSKIAKFARPSIGSKDFTVDNTFLYDYYYSESEFNDANADKYQNEYYGSSRKYENYPFFRAETPYLIGFPDDTYYEFDLSGEFVPLNTQTSIAKLDPQVITFVSNTGKGGSNVIDVTDDNNKTDKRSVSNGDYVYTGYYQDTEVIPVGGYVLNSTGSSFDKITAENGGAQAAEPFRCYFVVKTGSEAKARDTRRLIIGQDNSSKGDLDPNQSIDSDHTIKIYVQDRQLVVESSYETDLNIYYVSGQFVRRIHVEAGTNTYEGFRPGFYVVGRQKVHFKPGNY